MRLYTPVDLTGNVNMIEKLVLRNQVPQRSVAGAQTFVCYTENLQEVVTSFEIRYHLYADDSQLLDKATLQDLVACCLRIESCVESIR